MVEQYLVYCKLRKHGYIPPKTRLQAQIVLAQNRTPNSNPFFLKKKCPRENWEVINHEVDHTFIDYFISQNAK
jgi:hypothetical protein